MLAPGSHGFSPRFVRLRLAHSFASEPPIGSIGAHGPSAVKLPPIYAMVMDPTEVIAGRARPAL